MEIDDIGDIKKVRKSLGLTQQRLAGLSGVSQAMIARIESGHVEPSYSNAKKIFSALEGLMKPVGDLKKIMTKRVVSISSRDSVVRASRIMKSRGISQLPVMEKDRIVGMLSETDMVHILSTHKNPKSLLVKDVMNMPPPSLDVNSPMDATVSLLDHASAAIVTDRGRICGIVSRADLLKLMKR